MSFKWGTWYPIESYDTNRKKPGLFSVPTAASGWRERKTIDTWVPGATHWMPGPPSPEEMAAKPDLERIVRETRDYNLRQEWEAWDENGEIKMSAAEIRFDCLSAVLAEAGLE